jgi:hypothetical protein
MKAIGVIIICCVAIASVVWQWHTPNCAPDEIWVRGALFDLVCAKGHR